jgi:hypothetical protein
MQIMPTVEVPSTVEFGVRATISRGGRVHEIYIVGEDEADPSAGLIAWTAPLARALKMPEQGKLLTSKLAGVSNLLPWSPSLWAGLRNDATALATASIRGSPISIA